MAVYLRAPVYYIRSILFSHFELIVKCRILKKCIKYEYIFELSSSKQALNISALTALEPADFGLCFMPRLVNLSIYLRFKRIGCAAKQAVTWSFGAQNVVSFCSGI